MQVSEWGGVGGGGQKVSGREGFLSLKIKKSSLSFQVPLIKDENQEPCNIIQFKITNLPNSYFSKILIPYARFSGSDKTTTIMQDISGAGLFRMFALLRF